MRVQGRRAIPVDECISLHYAAVPAQPWPALAESWLPRLAPPKRAAVLRLRAPADRNASLLGVALLGIALADRGVAFVPSALEYPARGKPRLATGPEFSIAHAAGCVGCALATSGRVGFDLEARGAVTPGALRLALGAGELQQIAAGRLDADAAWVMTEAVLKAAGCGVEAAARVRLAGETAMLDGAHFWLAPVALAPTLVAWLATEAQRPAVAIARHRADEFAPLP
jgi:4'-phosphopantetheinyl transferase